MPWILSDIISLAQYLAVFLKKEFDIKRCWHCGKSGLWRHGHYPRKADRCGDNNRSLNPIYIQRYYCPSCERTCSVLPECISPRRWYLWEVQQTALILALAGESLRAIANKMMPSRHTVKRWVNRFKEQFHWHKDTLCNRLIELGRTVDFADFWSTCFKKISLAEAMRLCHVAGVSVP